MLLIRDMHEYALHENALHEYALHEYALHEYAKWKCVVQDSVV